MTDQFPKVTIMGAFHGNRTLPGLNDWLSEYGKSPLAGGRFKEDYMKVCLLSIRRDLRGWKVTKPPIITHFHYFENKKGVHRDVDNIHGFCVKVFHDALQKSGVIENDNPKWVENFTTEFQWIDGTPYIQIEIEERG